MGRVVESIDETIAAVILENRASFSRRKNETPFLVRLRGHYDDGFGFRRLCILDRQRHPRLLPAARKLLPEVLMLQWRKS
jgi:hypothetical protein